MQNYDLQIGGAPELRGSSLPRPPRRGMLNCERGMRDYHQRIADFGTDGRSSFLPVRRGAECRIMNAEL
jgi:hypothetical protein